MPSGVMAIPLGLLPTGISYPSGGDVVGGDVGGGDVGGGDVVLLLVVVESPGPGFTIIT